MQGAFVLLTCELIFTMSYSIVFHYPTLMPILRRETNDHMYSLSAYYVAEIFCIMPLAFLRSFVGVAFFWIGFQGDFLMYFTMSLTLFLTALTGNAYGLMVSGIFETVMTDLAAITDIIFLSLSGFYINLNAFPYLRYVSLFFFSNEALSILYWADVTDIGMDFNRPNVVLLSALHPPFIHISSLTQSIVLVKSFFFLFVAECPANLGSNCQRNGTEVLLDKSYNTQMIHVLWDYLGLIVLALIMHLLAFTGIRRIVRSIGYY